MIDLSSLTEAMREAGLFELEGAEFDLEGEGWKVHCRIERAKISFNAESAGKEAVTAQSKSLAASRKKP